MSNSPDAEACGRSRGRPRSEEADRAILAAALSLCAEEGFEGVTVEAVAARAGVGKATVYRRYATRADLVVAAAGHLVAEVAPDPDTGSVREDLRVHIRRLAQLLSATELGAVVPHVLAAALRNTELRAAYRSFIACRRGIAIAALERGIARGELRADTDVGLAADLLAGPVFHRVVNHGEPVDAARADAIVDCVLRVFVTEAGGAARGSTT